MLHVHATKPDVTTVRHRLASASDHASAHTGAPASPVNTAMAALTPDPPFPPVSPSLAVTRDCQPRCQHTLTQLSFTSHHPPRLPPVKLCAHGIYARFHNAPSRSTAFPLGSSTPPSWHAHAAEAPSPLRAPAYTRLALPPPHFYSGAPTLGGSTHTARARATPSAGTATAGRMTRTLSRPRPGPPLWCLCGAGKGACMQCCFREFPRASPPRQRARLCMNASIGRALRLASARVSESGPSMCQSHAQRGGGLCANRYACLLALVI